MSANASKSKIISLEDHRKEQLKKASAPPPFDPELVAQRINRVRFSPSSEERDLAIKLLLDDAEVMLRALGVMGAEIGAFRQQIKALVQQTSDTSTINSVLLERAGGVVRMPFEWFRDYEPPQGAGFMVNEEGDEVVIRAIVVDESALSGVGSVSASEQTEGN